MRARGVGLAVQSPLLPQRNTRLVIVACMEVLESRPQHASCSRRLLFPAALNLKNGRIVQLGPACSHMVRGVTFETRGGRHGLTRQTGIQASLACSVRATYSRQWQAQRGAIMLSLSAGGNLCCPDRSGHRFQNNHGIMATAWSPALIRQPRPSDANVCGGFV